jgi:anti-sigma factor RsiW
MLCSDLSENDLHALVDGELAGERLDGVAARLATDRAAAERVAAYAEQRAALTALREELALVAPPAPALCDLEQALRDALGRQRRVRHSAAVVGAAVVGGAAAVAAVATIGCKGRPALVHRTPRQPAAA